MVGIFSNQNPNLGKFWMSCNGRCWFILWPFGQFSRHLLYFMAIWYALWSFAIFSPFWYVAPRKIWQPWSKSVQNLNNNKKSKINCFDFCFKSLHSQLFHQKFAISPSSSSFSSPSAAFLKDYVTP
jgi:hypothetical protein